MDNPNLSCDNSANIERNGLKGMPDEKKMASVYEAKIQMLVEYCRTPRTLTEMMAHIGLTDIRSFRVRYTVPMQKAGLLRKTDPDNPTSRYQKYVSCK